MAVKLVAGLGNPGSRYQWTRHNAGFMVLDRFAQISGIPINRKGFSGLFGEGFWQGEKLLLLKPQTYMNLSGRSLSEAVRFHRLSLDDVVVIHDDLDVPFGRVKIKNGGGHGGHNGLRSIIAELGGGDFTRIRVGIDRPVRGDVVEYVLTPFSREEAEHLPEILDAAADALASLFENGLAKTMSHFNNRDLIAR